MEYITETTRQYKANLHSHSNISDGTLTPEEMADIYREHGYSILAITDHEAPAAHQDLNRPGFQMITGYEAYIRSDSLCRFDPFRPEIHLNLIAKDPANVTYIGYDAEFCKYLPHEAAEKLPQAGAGIRRYNREYLQEFIRTANEAGYLVSMNHPVWSQESESMLLGLKGCYSLEIYNTGSWCINGGELNTGLYDAYLRNGSMIYCHGADDNHNKKPLDDLLSDSFGAWTQVLAKDLSYASVIHALENGDFYASTGPSIRVLAMNGGHVHVECSPAQRILLVRSMKRCQNAYRPDGSDITSADFDLPEQETPYAYIIVMDRYGHQAHTRAFTRTELGL
jgi:hypothetical protein